MVQVAVLRSGGGDGSDDESWGDELEKELEGEAEVAVRTPHPNLAHTIAGSFSLADRYWRRSSNKKCTLYARG